MHAKSCMGKQKKVKMKERLEVPMEPVQLDNAVRRR